MTSPERNSLSLLFSGSALVLTAAGNVLDKKYPTLIAHDGAEYDITYGDVVGLSAIVPLIIAGWLLFGGRKG